MNTATIEAQPNAIRTLQTVAASPLDLPAEQFQAGLDRRKSNRSALLGWIREALVKGVDFGCISTKSGPSKPSLWKPGAEKICGMLGVTAHFPTLADYEQAALRGVEFRQIVVRCEIRDGAGRVVADGVGARSLQQDSGDVNKALKMAEKSAHIDATLRMAGLSEVFTQDLEDRRPVNRGELWKKSGAGEGREARVAAPTGLHSGASDAARSVTGATAQPGRISKAQHRRLEARIKTLGVDRDRVKAWVSRATQGRVPHLNELSPALYRKVDGKLEVWAADEARARETERAQAQQRRKRLLQEARHWGWSGEMSDLPRIVEQMKESAKSARRKAQYADRGYQDEIRDAEETERLAAGLAQIAAETNATTAEEQH